MASNKAFGVIEAERPTHAFLSRFKKEFARHGFHTFIGAHVPGVQYYHLLKHSAQ